MVRAISHKVSPGWATTERGITRSPAAGSDANAPVVTRPEVSAKTMTAPRVRRLRRKVRTLGRVREAMVVLYGPENKSGSMVVAMGDFLSKWEKRPKGRCSGNRSERVFYSLPEQVFVVKHFTEQMFCEQVFDLLSEHLYALPMSEALTPRQREILNVISTSMQERGYPPSVREIGEAVGLNSPSTVHNHLTTLQKMGFLRRDPTKPRALEVRFDTNSEVAMERRPSRHVPLIGEVAAGTGLLAQQNVEDLIPLPTDFTGEGELFMLRVRGDSMIDAGILDGDFVVVRQQQTADNGDIVVAGIPGDEATVKTFKKSGNKITLVPSHPTMEPMVFSSDEVNVFGKVVTVMRRL